MRITIDHRPIIGPSTPSGLLPIPAGRKQLHQKRLSISSIFFLLFRNKTKMNRNEKNKKKREKKINDAFFFCCEFTQRWLNNSLHPALYYCNTSKWFWCYVMSYTATIPLLLFFQRLHLFHCWCHAINPIQHSYVHPFLPDSHFFFPAIY